MGLFDFLSPPPCPGSLRPEVDRLVEELVRIGKTDDFLSERPGSPFNMQCRHTRAREIGKRLDEIGGIALMDWVHRRVRKLLGKGLAAHLEYAWTDVGKWLA